MKTDFDAVHLHIESIMPKIEREPQGFIRHPYLAVSHGQHYAGAVYTWDHFHMALRFSLSGKPQYLRHQVDNVLEYQRADGLVPSMILANEDPSASNQHAQPFLLQAAWRYTTQTNDTGWAAEVFPKLQEYLAHYERENRASNGLFFWKETFMSGIDNDVATVFFTPKTIIPCDLSAWMCLEYEAAALLSERIGRSIDAGNYRREFDALRDLIEDILWCPEAGSYSAYNLRKNSHQFHYEDPYLDIPIGSFAFQTCSNLIPLYAGVATAEHARAMIEKYVLGDEHFLSPYGIRTLSRSSSYYNNAIWGNPPRFGNMDVLTTSNWQGPVWILLNYFMFHALHHYGFPKEAGHLANRTIQLLARSLERIGSFTENFDAETGFPLYAQNFASWNILADTMRPDLSMRIPLA